MKSDDMEELFREAAEKYHVDTEKAAAWNDVYAALQGDEQPGPVPPGNKRNKRWLNLLWLLLIPLGWFAHNFWDDARDGKTAKKQETVQNSNTASTGDNGNNAENSTAKAGNGSKAATPGANDKAVNGNTQQATGTGSDNNTGVASAGARNNSFTANGRRQIKIAGGNIGTTTGSDDKNTPGNKITANTPAMAAPPISSTTPGGSNNTVASPVSKATPGGSSNTTAPPQATVAQSGNTVKDNATNTHTEAAAPPVVTNTTAANTHDNNNNSKTVKDKKPGTNSEHYIYAGMVASPDISFIHGQKTSPVGISAGIIVGYAFNKHLSVETGVLYDKKNYYTKGQYFDKDRIEWFKQHPEIKVIEMQGNCKMIELPINIRYTFVNKNKNKVYASAGLSTYFMGKEYYDYTLDDWGSQYPKGVSYNNHIKNWFSIMNVGVGYERQIGTKTSLRVEPFIKLPVSGVGSGKINLTSSGLYIGVTRRIP